MIESRFALSVDEAAAYTGIGRNTLRQLVSWGASPTLRVGRKILIRRDALEQFVITNEGRNLRNRSDIVPVAVTVQRVANIKRKAS